MEVQLDLAIAYAANSFDEALRLIVLLANPNHFLEFHPRLSAERRLMDGLISRIQFRNDKVACRTKREHPGCVGIVIGPQSSETRKKAMVQVDNPPTCKLPAGVWRQDPHVPR